MRKIFMMSALALAVAGCANPNNRPEVRDVSEAQKAVKESSGYTVKAGDTLYGIAWQHNLDYRNLAAMNDIDPPYNIYPGQKIRLREGASVDSGRQAASADTSTRSSGGAKTTGLGTGSAATASAAGGASSQQVDWLLPDDEPGRDDAAAKTADDATDTPDSSNDVRVAEQNGSAKDSSATQDSAAKDSAAKGSATKDDASRDKQPADKTKKARSEAEVQAPAAKPEPKPEPKREERRYTPAKNIAWQWPVKGELVGRFDDDSGITAGIDIAGEKGQPVKAAGPGIVVYAGSGVRGYGNLVLLKHNDHFLSAYAHNDSLNVSENDVVKAGEVIATMGDSDADSVKLHFEVRKDGEPEDPLTYLP